MPCAISEGKSLDEISAFRVQKPSAKQTQNNAGFYQHCLRAVSLCISLYCPVVNEQGYHRPSVANNIIAYSESYDVKHSDFPESYIATIKTQPHVLDANPCLQVLTYFEKSTKVINVWGINPVKLGEIMDITRIDGIGLDATSSAVASRCSVSAAGPIMPHVKAGRLKALAVSSPKPSALVPDLPTVAATVPGYALEGYYCMFAPVGTPDETVRLLNREDGRVLQDDGVRAKFLAAGVEPRGGAPEELGAVQKADMAKMADLIREAGLKAE